MGHDHHFLERLDRASREHVEFALGLYRDHEALRYLLAHLRLGDATARVALSLAEGERGPWAVVTREGAFVTCLGEGMSTGPLEIVPRARLDALLAKHRDQKARDSARSLETRANESLSDFFVRLYRRGDAMTREEFVALSSVQPLLAARFYEIAVESTTFVLQSARTLRRAHKLNAPEAALGAEMERTRWLAGHMALLASMGDRRVLEPHVRVAIAQQVSLSEFVTMLGSNTIALRAAWMAARIGKPLLATYRPLAPKAASLAAAVDVSLAVLAIGLRHERARNDARRLLESMRAPGSESDSAAEVRRVCAEHALEVLDGGVSTADALADGRELFVSMAQHLPAGDPYSFADASAVPDDLAMTTALEDDAFYGSERGMRRLYKAASLLARARAEDFYFPREVATRVIVEASTDDIVDYVSRLQEIVKLAPDPVRQTPRPGRNDPCSCGSGKKFKKCCG